MTTAFAEEVAQTLESAGVKVERNAYADFTATLPGALYPVPSEAALDGEYTPAADLERIADELIRDHRLTVARDCRIVYLWRDKGGKSKGKRTLGKCQKPSGLLRHFSECDFVIWLAADHLREMGATHLQVTAALFHELCHIGETDSGEDEDSAGPELTVLPHDVEMFGAEVRAFGLWKEDLREAGHAFEQLRLDLEVRR